MSAHIGLHLVRVTLMAGSPISIGSDERAIEEIEFEQAGELKKKAVTYPALIRGPDGLPAIPGASLQGVLRHLATARFATRDVNHLLGYAESEDRKQASRVTFGWGRAHGQDDQCVDPVSAFLEGTNDQILRLLQSDAPLMRDHVALDERGVVAGRTKFLRAAVPAGTRFSFELTMRGPEAELHATEEGVSLAALLSLLSLSEFRLGWGGSRGYGAVTVVRASHQWFKMDEEGITVAAAKRTEQASTPLETDVLDQIKDPAPLPGSRHCTVALEAEDLVVIGGPKSESHVPAGAWAKNLEMDELWAADERVRSADLTAKEGRLGEALRVLHEERIDWTDGLGAVTRVFTLPGSSLRGVLAHRSLYWWNRNEGQVVTPGSSTPDDVRKFAARPPALAALFGAIKDSGNGTGRRGALTIADGQFVADWIMRVDHVSIDRFTGGARDRTGGLFAEETLFGAKATMKLDLAPRPADVASADWKAACDALDAALRDLCGGRLALGARGHGTMEGEFDWQETPMTEREHAHA